MTEVICSIISSVSVSFRWKMDASSLLSPRPVIAGLGNVNTRHWGIAYYSRWKKLPCWCELPGTYRCTSHRSLAKAHSCELQNAGRQIDKKVKETIPNRGIEPRPCRNWSPFDDWERQILATRPIRMNEQIVRLLLFDEGVAVNGNIISNQSSWAAKPSNKGHLIFHIFHLPS